MKKWQLNKETNMKKYKVKLMFVYSDIIHVEAENEREAEYLAFKECNEEYDYYYDSKIEEE